ncbi:DUF1080 domain-containing protein [candidate division KSB1 bacterium]
MKPTKGMIVIFLICMITLINCSEKMDDGEEFYVPPHYNVGQMYSESAPQPPVVTPPPAFTTEAPSDAVVLFDGSDLSQWTDNRGNPPQWKVENGYMEIVKDTRGLITKQSFGSCQLHIEWASPEEVKGDSQGRGNSGVYLMGLYEIQVLDSYENPTYPTGMAASVYGQNPPLVNASRGPGEWQTYDIIFQRPVFKDGKALRPAVITVFHNGVLVQDHFEIMGATVYKKVPKYTEHEDRLPLSLQDHSNPVRYRNIWIRELPDK